MLYNYTRSEVSSHWGANTVWIHLSRLFCSIPSQHVFDLRLEQEIKVCVKRNALFVIGVKQSSGRLIFPVLRFPSSYNCICNISLLWQMETISCCDACVVWDREQICHHIIPFNVRSLRNYQCRIWFMNINLLFVNVLLQILCYVAPIKQWCNLFKGRPFNLDNLCLFLLLMCHEK